MLRRRRRFGQRGFTLIELMVALVVSSLLVGMILAIFTRMSLAYRGQQQVAGVQQVLAAARATIEVDAKQAGLEMAQGFKTASDTTVSIHSPVVQVNSSTGPDQIAFYYADTTAQAAITGVVGTWSALPAISVDVATDFVANDLIVLSTPTFTQASPINPGVMANITTFDACVLQIASVVGTTVTFSQLAPWGSGTTSHCTSPTANQTMMYKFVAHAYRIDNSTPARAALGPLQMSPSGGLIGTVADNWTDLAYGFTDIQTATQFFDNDGIDSPDADTDGNREWYSDVTQQNLTQLGVLPATFVPPIQMTISLVARTDRDVEGIATAATPNLSNGAIPNNNQIGDHASVALPSATDDLLKGSRIYRFSTFQVDFRNIGVGR